MATTDLYSQLLNPVAPEIMGLERQRQYARMLMQQSAQPQGQMVSGQFVAPSWTQQLNAALNPIVGAYLSKSADTEANKLAKKLRDEQTRLGKEYFQSISPSVEMTEMAGPYGMTDTGMNIPMPTMQRTMQPNYQRAFEIASDPNAPTWLKAQAAELLKPQKVGEGETVYRFNPATGQNEVVAQGAEKFRAPLQTDTGTMIEYRDPKDPTKVLARVAKTQMPTAGQVVEREDGTFLVDTRTGQAKPVVGPQGQPLTGGKPLTEVQSNAVAFGARAIEANRIATDLENKGFTNTGVVRTAVAGTLGQAPIVGGRLEQGVRSTFNVLPEFAGGPSPQQQQNDQARRNFISAVLRKESGAAIGVEEYANEERKYFPQIGDSSEVIKQKQDARQLAIKALESQAGSSGKRQIEKITNQQLSALDQEALSWANANPNDQRSAQIKQRLGR
jgi:hypothetical protein